MKKQLMLCWTILSISCAAAQNQPDTVKRYRHELGIDATSFVKQFLSFNGNVSYQGTYYVTYRFHFKKSNIRFGIGGFFNKYQTGIYTVNGEEKLLYSTSRQLFTRIGYEWKSELSKRWQIYYGIDFRPGFDFLDSQGQNSSGGYIYGSQWKTQIFGLAPLLGVRFRITNRISLMTELSFTFKVENRLDMKTYISQDVSLYPEIPPKKDPVKTSIYSAFNQPVFLVFAVDL